ncbi:DDE-type integrase/transposase/recombinase [Streptomyces sp. NBC_01455]|uniref:DDE-type integrase/transposase/recombinase n=1 Tax=Streptomyces sp. NBC_01455 TaxID=2903874 RepID=UPI002E301209|nr:DDE-type integrase/transposase/recombinase [Streptomyces sp. NBC_01455]
MPDLVMRDLTADMLNTKWCGDITYVAIGPTWLYLATVIDICSRRVIGWSIAYHMRTLLVTDGIEMAVAARGGQVHGVVFHTDRNSPNMDRPPSPRSGVGTASAAAWAASAQAMGRCARRTRHPWR